MYLSPISYQSNVINNKNIRFRAGKETMVKEGATLLKDVLLPAGAAIAGVNALVNISKKPINITEQEAAEKLKQAGYSNQEIYAHKFDKV